MGSQLNKISILSIELLKSLFTSKKYFFPIFFSLSNTKKNTTKELGRILFKGDNVALVRNVE